MTDTKEIRKQMKTELGYNARQVSVKNRNYTSFEFTIRDISVDFSQVKEFSKQFEKIDYCQHTQEILSGGNTFVNVRIDESVVKQAVEKFGSYVSDTLLRLDELGDNQGCAIQENAMHILTKKVDLFNENEWTVMINIDGKWDSGRYSRSGALNGVCITLWEQGIEFAEKPYTYNVGTKF